VASPRFEPALRTRTLSGRSQCSASVMLERSEPALDVDPLPFLSKRPPKDLHAKFGNNLGTTPPKHRGKRGSRADQKAGRINKMEVPAPSAKPPSRSNPGRLQFLRQFSDSLSRGSGEARHASRETSLLGRILECDPASPDAAGRLPSVWQHRQLGKRD